MQSREKGTIITMPAQQSVAISQQPVPASLLVDDGPDFDAYIEAVARNAAAFSKPVEALFTIAMIFSVTLTPFVMFQAIAPELMIIIMSSAWVFAFIPYIIIMMVLGAKLSSLFGCQVWWRITRPLYE